MKKFIARVYPITEIRSDSIDAIITRLNYETTIVNPEDNKSYKLQPYEYFKEADANATCNSIGHEIKEAIINLGDFRLLVSGQSDTFWCYNMEPVSD